MVLKKNPCNFWDTQMPAKIQARIPVNYFIYLHIPASFFHVSESMAVAGIT